MKKTVLISGINGFLASHLLNLLKDKYIVYGIARTESLVDDFQTFSSSKINEITINPDFVILIHASVSSGNTVQDNDLLYESNVALTEKICNRFPKSKIIYISSASIFNNDGSVINEHTIDNPSTNYAISKLWAEKIVLKYSNSIIVRLSSLYGIGMKENTILPNYINQALNNKTIEVWGKGERCQNYIHVNDVALLLEKVIENFESITKKIVLAVDNNEFSNIEVAAIIAEQTNAKIMHCNNDDSKSIHYNNSITKNQLNWNPITDFTKGIQEYIQWKQKQY